MKKKAIIEAALQLLVENGIHATPMSAIAKAAGTGMGTIYNYFPTKEILINAIYVDIKLQLEALLLVPTNKKTIKTQFKYHYLLVTNFYLQYPNYYKLMNQLQNSPIITVESKNEGIRSIDPVIKLLKRGQKEGIIKKINIETMLQFIGGAILSHLDSIINSKTTIATDTSIKENFQMVWDGIKK